MKSGFSISMRRISVAALLIAGAYTMYDDFSQAVHTSMLNRRFSAELEKNFVVDLRKIAPEGSRKIRVMHPYEPLNEEKMKEFFPRFSLFYGVPDMYSRNHWAIIFGRENRNAIALKIRNSDWCLGRRVRLEYSNIDVKLKLRIPTQKAGSGDADCASYCQRCLTN